MSASSGSSEFLDELRRRLQQLQAPAPAAKPGCDRFITLQKEIHDQFCPVPTSKARFLCELQQFPSAAEWANNVMTAARAAGLLDGYTLEAIYGAWHDYVEIADCVLAKEARRQARKALQSSESQERTR